MDSNRIIETAYELVKVIKESLAFQQLKKYEHEVFENEHTKQLLDKFNKYKDLFAEASKYGEYYPQLEKIKKDFQQAKINLMYDEIFRKYKENEKIIDKQILEIEIRIQNALNIKNKHDKKDIKLQD